MLLPAIYPFASNKNNLESNESSKLSKKETKNNETLETLFNHNKNNQEKTIVKPVPTQPILGLKGERNTSKKLLLSALISLISELRLQLSGNTTKEAAAKQLKLIESKRKETIKKQDANLEQIKKQDEASKTSSILDIFTKIASVLAVIAVFITAGPVAAAAVAVLMFVLPQLMEALDEMLKEFGVSDDVRMGITIAVELTIDILVLIASFNPGKILSSAAKMSVKVTKKIASKLPKIISKLASKIAKKLANSKNLQTMARKTGQAATVSQSVTQVTQSSLNIETTVTINDKKNEEINAEMLIEILNQLIELLTGAKNSYKEVSQDTSQLSEAYSKMLSNAHLFYK